MYFFSEINYKFYYSTKVCKIILSNSYRLPKNLEFEVFGKKSCNNPKFKKLKKKS